MAEIDRDIAASWHAMLSDSKALRRRITQFAFSRKRLNDIERKGIKRIEDQGFWTLVLNRTKPAGILARSSSICRNSDNAKGMRSWWYPGTLARNRAEFKMTDGMA